MYDEPADYSVTIKVRNGRLLAAMRRAGHYSVTAFARTNGISIHTVYDYLSLKTPPYGPRGVLRPSAQRLVDVLGGEIEDLFPPSALTNAMISSSITVGMSEGQIASLIDGHHTAIEHHSTTPEQALIGNEGAELIASAIESLPAGRMRDVLEMRFGLGRYDREYTLDEVGQVFKVGRERVRQIEARALRYLKHPSRKKLLEAARDAVA